MTNHSSHPTPTLEDVAQLAGVATSTVSRVINGTGQISQKTAERVWQAIKELNYRPHSAARKLAGGANQAIGFVALEVTTPFVRGVLGSIEQVASRNGFDVLVYTTYSKQNAAESYNRPLGPHNTDGVIAFANALAAETLTEMGNSGFPVVLMHQSSPEGVSIPTVTFENKKSAYQIVEHLITVHQCQTIAYIRGREDEEDSIWRENGYRKALQDHGLQIDENLIGTGGFAAEDAPTVVQKWIDQKTDLDAVFCFDDDTALAAIYTFVRNGIQVPEDIAVVGFDDAYPQYYLGPPLTTVRAPIEMAGQVSAETLIRIIRGEEVDPLTLLPTEIVIRNSCGCGASRN